SVVLYSGTQPDPSHSVQHPAPSRSMQSLLFGHLLSGLSRTSSSVQRAFWHTGLKYFPVCWFSPTGMQGPQGSSSGQCELS
ncbi:MAG TPA: hypothetical protein VGC79_08330, partial [Polyangiaceae bacterium]